MTDGGAERCADALLPTTAAFGGGRGPEKMQRHAFEQVLVRKVDYEPWYPVG